MYYTQFNVNWIINVAGQVSKGVPRQAEVAQGVPGRLRPRVFLTFRHYKGGRSSAKRTGRLYPTRNLWYSLSDAESTSGHMVLSGVPRKKSPVTPPGIKAWQVRIQIHLRPDVYGFHSTDTDRTHRSSINFCVHCPYRILQKSDESCGKYRPIFMIISKVKL